MKIAAAAVIDHEGGVVSLPVPARHGDILAYMKDRGDPLPIVGDQGFITNDGAFIDRYRAREIAEQAGQLLPDAYNLKQLYSEDVW